MLGRGRIEPVQLSHVRAVSRQEEKGVMGNIDTKS